MGSVNLFRNKFTEVLGLPLVVMGTALFWAQGSWVGYILHEYVMHGQGQGFLPFANQLISEQTSTLVYIGLGSSLFFAMFGYVMGLFLEHLRETGELKDRCIAVFSHDIRNPLAAILGHVGLLQMEEGLGAQSRAQLKQIEASGSHMMHVLEEVLEMERAKRDGKSNRGPVVLGDVAKETMRLYGNLAAKKGIKFNYTNTNLGAPINGNKTQLIRATSNLISNAIKFSRRSSSIDVQVGATESGHPYLAVTDHGIGIPQDLIHRVLADGASVRRKGTEGESTTGIGLAVVREVAGQHNARLEVTSAEGKGSTFSIQFERNKSA